MELFPSEEHTQQGLLSFIKFQQDKYRLSKAELATILEVSEALISLVYSGKRKVSVKLIKKIKVKLTDGFLENFCKRRQLFKELYELRLSNIEIIPNKILSDRQTECLQALLINYGDKKVTHEKDLLIQEKTFKTHLSRIYKKLKVHSAAGAVIRALKLGLVEVKTNAIRNQSNDECN